MGGILENLPVKNLIPIFTVTFIMIFVIFVLVEPSMYCEAPEDSLFPSCSVIKEEGGNFTIGLLISGVLFLLDMALLYMTLGDFFLPDLASDSE